MSKLSNLSDMQQRIKKDIVSIYLPNKQQRHQLLEKLDRMRFKKNESMQDIHFIKNQEKNRSV